MNEVDYRDFLSFLFERYVRPRLAQMRERHMHHFGWEMSYSLDRSVRAGRMIRFIESDCTHAEDIYRTFTLERIGDAISATFHGVSNSNTWANSAGFLDAIEIHLAEIAGGLSTVSLPEADEAVLREIGSVNPKVELRSLAYRAKRWMEKRDRQTREASLRQELDYAEQKLKKEADDFQERIRVKKDQPLHHLGVRRIIDNTLRRRRAAK